jgi:hypothetical protein
MKQIIIEFIFFGGLAFILLECIIGWPFHKRKGKDKEGGPTQ